MAFATRIRAVRFKSGGEVRVLNAGRELHHAKVLQALRDEVEWVTEKHDCLAGFALVAWGADTKTSTEVVLAKSSPILRYQVPTFVASCIQRELAERDTKGIVNRALGIPDEKA
jgi:hypothetical protein